MHQTIEPNPFRTAVVRPGSIPFHDETAVESLAQKFCQHRVGQIVGQHGSGKSTLVASLEHRVRDRFENVQRICLVQPEINSRLSALRHGFHVAKTVHSVASERTPQECKHFLIIVDGAEQMLTWTRWRFLSRIRRSGVACLLTSHRPLVQVPVLFKTQVTAELVTQLSMNQVRKSSPLVRELVRQDLSLRDLETVNNLRDYWFELYDVVQPHLQSCPAYREQRCG